MTSFYIKRGRYWAVCALIIVFFLQAGEVYAQNSPFAAVEVIASQGQQPGTGGMLSLCKKYGLPSSAVYQWNNHLVVYGKLKDAGMLRYELARTYPACEVKLYEDPFYDFDRGQHCGKQGIAPQWDNILLTANLVANPKLQQEYLDYHATQFKKWPEVANGFCNAGFQQLLVFKNGRQLLLVISIPKGASLDKLNPKTSENNPRVDQWNALMKKYQEGISGTRSGEVWVYLKPLNTIENHHE